MKSYKEGDIVPIEKYDCGVLIGRFQVPELHEAHKQLFNTVVNNHKKVICLLGLCPVKSSVNDPLDYQQRKAMIQEDYPNVICLYVKDCRDDEQWSKAVDLLIEDNTMPGQKALLYGSRDSFIEHYVGRYDTAELESKVIVSGTEIRKKITRDIQSSKDFRAGAIWSLHNTYASPKMTVDIAILRGNDILLAKKPGETQFRFIGGFCESSQTLEQNAAREVKEESGVDVKDLKYLASFVVDDWRYRAQREKIMTAFFTAQYSGGNVQAQDDVEFVQWINKTAFLYEEGTSPLNEKYNLKNIVAEHRPLMTKLLQTIK